MVKFLKNKKASEVIETIITMPIFIWLLLFSVFKIWVSIEETNASIYSERYVRNIAIGTSFENSMNNVAKNYSDEYKITKITISNDGLASDFTLIFSDEENSNAAFGHFVIDGSFDIISYYASLDTTTRNSLKTISNLYWNRETTITIQVRKELLNQSVQDAFALTYQDPIENAEHKLSFGLNTSTESNTSSIIYIK